MEILTIGSIIEKNDYKLIIVGYREIQDEKFDFCYIVGLFPFGFTGNTNSLSLLPIDSDFSILAKGYMDASGERYMSMFTEKVKSLKGITSDAVDKTLDLIIEKMGGRKND